MNKTVAVLIDYSVLNTFFLRYPEHGCVRTQERLGQYTSLKCGGTADFFCDVSTYEGLQKIVSFCCTNGALLKVLGNGTDVLIKDGGVKGCVIRLTGKPFNALEQIDERRFRIGSRVLLSEILCRTANLGLSGMEAMSGIPASLGGALSLNAGAYGERIASLVESIEVMTLQGEIQQFAREQLEFQYRKGPFDNGEIILNAVLVFVPGERKKILRHALDVALLRDYKLPHGYSAGCIFKNPSDISAGALIEKTGLKGIEHYGARISPKHGNIIINENNAHSDRILDLIALMRSQVKDRQGVDLSLEIKIWE
ncbi:MAG: UDP-N-acetylmuramate dehydrogenase [bacterium]|nr:UDP-N-acetylmuramate dehydrogenase [bacterium]